MMRSQPQGIVGLTCAHGYSRHNRNAQQHADPDLDATYPSLKRWPQSLHRVTLALAGRRKLHPDVRHQWNLLGPPIIRGARQQSESLPSIRRMAAIDASISARNPSRFVTPSCFDSHHVKTVRFLIRISILITMLEP